MKNYIKKDVHDLNKEIQLIWDFDDTIVKTHEQYVKTNRIVASTISFDLYGDEAHTSNVANYQRKLDVEMVSTYGFTPGRYLLSWLETYKHFAKERNKDMNPLVQQNMESDIKDLYQRKYTNMTGSIKVLSELKNAGFPMVVLTAGDKSIQTRKVIESGAAEFMNEIHVSTTKTPDVLQGVMDIHPAKDYVMIGNSLKSDIYPALENNIWGFHVQRDTWEADEYDIDKTNEKYVNLSSLSEVHEQLKQLNKGSLLRTS